MTALTGTNQNLKVPCQEPAHRILATLKFPQHTLTVLLFLFTSVCFTAAFNTRDTHFQLPATAILCEPDPTA